MLKKVWLTEKRDNATPTAILLGGFDGLHIGHRQLLRVAKNSDLPVGVMTIVGGKGEENLFTFSERESILKESGADFVLELPFSEIKHLSAEEFLEILQRECNPALFVCGEDFRFGAGAQGDITTLKEKSSAQVIVLPLVKMHGEKVSSRWIKERLKNGEIEQANDALGENFFLIGEVKSDRKIGRTLGFPTANICYPQGKFPLKIGVYETRVCVDGVEYKGITNYGARPTFLDESVWTETYLDRFSGDLYGRKLKVEFVRFLREIKKFDSVESLKEQLSKDIKGVREND